MSKANTIQQPKLLIVEGNHERDFFEAWLLALGLRDIQVLPIGGKTRLRENLVALVKQYLFPTVTSLVVVRDADDNPAGAFQSVCDALLNARLPTPDEALTLTIGTTPTVGIAVMPATDRTGALEELLLDAAIADPLAASAQQFITDAVAVLDATGHRAAPPEHRRGKARVHAYLATFEEPDKDPGKAALAGVWDFNHAALAPLLQLLQRM